MWSGSIKIGIEVLQYIVVRLEMAKLQVTCHNLQSRQIAKYMC
jgi:hypothetical protein